MGIKEQRKPKFNYIDINTIESQIDNCVIDFFSKYNIDLNDFKTIKSIPHNTINLCFRYIYSQLFKPNKGLWNNQKSLIDYDDIELLNVIANKFIDICLMFNKSLGLMSFSLMSGISYTTLAEWKNNEKLNVERSLIIKNIIEMHKAEQIALLNDTPVGALAVANNDIETGLQWSQNAAQQITNNTVYLIPSERAARLNLEKTEL